MRITIVPGLLGLFLAGAIGVNAHPGGSIVVDANGQIFVNVYRV